MLRAPKGRVSKHAASSLLETAAIRGLLRNEGVGA